MSGLTLNAAFEDWLSLTISEQKEGNCVGWRISARSCPGKALKKLRIVQATWMQEQRKRRGLVTINLRSGRLSTDRTTGAGAARCLHSNHVHDAIEFRAGSRQKRQPGLDTANKVWQV